MSVGERPAPGDGSSDDALLRTVRANIPNPAQIIGVAVSGGGDSMALLHLLHRLAQPLGFQIAAVTVNHGIRPAAVGEADFVARSCAQMNIPHDTLAWAGADANGNLMAAARVARYRLIADWGAARGIGFVALGHTLDDQAENFLIRLARKSGPDGLASMDMAFERHGVHWLRPLLQQRRGDLRDYLRRHGLGWIDDPTNEDDTFDRARARKALVTLYGLGITADVLESVGQTMRSTRDALDHFTQRVAARAVSQQGGDLLVSFDPDDPPPDEINRRLWRRILPWVSGAAYPPRNRVLWDVINDPTDGTATLGGCVITHKAGVRRVSREYQAVRALACETTDIWDGRWRLDGPHAPDLMVRALGDGILDCPDWRATNMPRQSLQASPAIWRDDRLVAAPLAGFGNGWSARIVADFHSGAIAIED